MTKKIIKSTQIQLESPNSSANMNTDGKVLKTLEVFYKKTIRSIEYENNKENRAFNTFPRYNTDSYIRNTPILNRPRREHIRKFYGECKNLDMLADVILSTSKYSNDSDITNHTRNYRETNDSNVFDIETLEDELEKQTMLINKTGYTQQLLENRKTVLFCKWKNCDASFKSKYYVFKHIKTHIDVLPFRCQICGMRFIRKDNGKAHLKICIRKRLTRR